MGSANIIHMADYRRSKQANANKRVLYLSNTDEFFTTLNSFPFLEVLSVTSRAALELKKMLYEVNLIVIEADLRWTKPVELVANLHQTLEVPIVMIAKDSHTEKTQAIIKEAYTAGLYDVLFSPLCPKEFFESLRVLLKLPLPLLSQH